MRCVGGLALAATAAGHGLVTLPPSRQGGTLAVAGQLDGSDASKASWGTDRVHIPGNVTLTDPALQTTCKASCTKEVPTGGPAPWCAPGSTPILSPCGNYRVGHRKGPDPITDGVKLPPVTPRALWQRGATVDVAWAIWQNHGGGYAWRLCPVSDEPTEECFAAHHLALAGDTSTVRFTNGTQVPIPARRTTQGTTPSGSQWTRNPIPCSDVRCDSFTEPCAGCNGDYSAFSIVDQLTVPVGLAPGDYVLSWRWDCDNYGCLWAQCTDVTVQ